MKPIYLPVLLVFWVMSCLLQGVVMAQTVYRYKDSNDRWVFTDRPSAGATTQAQQMPAREDERSGYGLYTRPQGETFELRAFNTLPVPVQIQVKASSATSSFSPPLPLERVIDGKAEETITRFPLNFTESEEKLQYRFVLGRPNALHAPSHPYRLPFLPGETFRVTQAFNGRFSHNNEGSRYAVDIAMPEGTIVCAARSGVVVEVEHANYLGGENARQYGKKANLVRILHKDGTMAVYAHLQMETVIPEIGEQVTAGQVIARSGNTGFSTGPHLHFVIQRNSGMQLSSVPFQFTTGRPYPGQRLSFE